MPPAEPPRIERIRLCEDGGHAAPTRSFPKPAHSFSTLPHSKLKNTEEEPNRWCENARTFAQRCLFLHNGATVPIQPDHSKPAESLAERLPSSPSNRVPMECDRHASSPPRFSFVTPPESVRKVALFSFPIFWDHILPSG